jgi:hypothetical protein
MSISSPGGGRMFEPKTILLKSSKCQLTNSSRDRKHDVKKKDSQKQVECQQKSKAIDRP